MRHADQVVVLVILPLVQGFLRPDRELLPPDEPIRELAACALVPRLSHAALIDDLVQAPAVGQEGQNLGHGINPGIAHVIHAALHELSRFPVLRRGAARLDVPRCLLHQHLDGEQDGPHNVVVLRHLVIGFYAPASAKLREELLVEDSAVAPLADASDLFITHYFSPPLLPHIRATVLNTATAG